VATAAPPQFASGGQLEHAHGASLVSFCRCCHVCVAQGAGFLHVVAPFNKGNLREKGAAFFWQERETNRRFFFFPPPARGVGNASQLKHSSATVKVGSPFDRRRYDVLDAVCRRTACAAPCGCGELCAMEQKKKRVVSSQFFYIFFGVLEDDRPRLRLPFLFVLHR
jgi:hypothetical protein